MRYAVSEEIGFSDTCSAEFGPTTLVNLHWDFFALIDTGLLQWVSIRFLLSQVERHWEEPLLGFDVEGCRPAGKRDDAADGFHAKNFFY